MSARYSRQIILPQVGVEGQTALKNAKVLLIGAGGLGLPCAQSLVAAGLGALTILDDDRVSLSNLQRQILFGETDLDRLKVEVAVEKLLALNSECKIQGMPSRFNLDNARALVSEHDLVIDGSDNFSTKFLINDVCILEKKTWVYGSISRFEGQLAVFNAEEGSCYRCLYEKPPISKIENCAEQGVFGAVTGIIGNYQALEALKILMYNHTGKSELRPQFGLLRVFDFLSLEQESLLIPRREHCQCDRAHSFALKEEGGPVCDIGFKRTWSDFNKDAGKKLLFDVRSAEEFETGHHSQSEWGNDEKFNDLCGGGYEREAQIYLYCWTGKRAQMKCQELREKGVSAFYIAESGVSY